MAKDRAHIPCQIRLLHYTDGSSDGCSRPKGRKQQRPTPYTRKAPAITLYDGPQRVEGVAKEHRGAEVGAENIEVEGDSIALHRVEREGSHGSRLS
jgi:hypothetical protein